MRKLCSAAFGFAFLLSGCNAVTEFVKPYRIDVRQGNYVTQEMVSQLRPGMSREQVRYVLGTPLIADVFHADRWDYQYRLQPGKGPVQSRRITAIFEDDRLVRVEGDVRAQGAEPEAARP